MIRQFFGRSANFLLLPAYWFSFIIPKDKNLWIFGAWLGGKFADNPKYLFLYVKNTRPEIRPVWLSHDQSLVRDLRGMGYEAYTAYSMKGLLVSVRAGCVITSTGIVDANRFVIGGARRVQLWHGTPLKKIGYDDKITQLLNEGRKGFTAKLKNILRNLLPYSVEDDDMCISPSEEVSSKFASAFAMPKERVRLTGYPRNDAFFNVLWQMNRDASFVDRIRQITQCKHVIAYLPTHREEGRRRADYLFTSYGFNGDDFNRLLKRYDAALVIKTHYYNRLEDGFDGVNSRIYMPSDSQLPDIYPLLKAADILITDYSSVYFDYLLLGRPIIFAPFDLEDYLKRDRELYYDYNTVTPGPKAKNWPEVLELIDRVMKEDEWKENREQICMRFNEFRDGESSRRVFEEIRSLLKS